MVARNKEYEASGDTRSPDRWSRGGFGFASDRKHRGLDVGRLSRGPRHSHRRQPRPAEDRSAERYAECIRTLRYGTRSSTRWL